MSYRQGYTELEGQFTTVVGTTVSGNAVATNTLAAAASEIGTTELADNAASGLKVSPEYGPVGTGSPVAYGLSMLMGSGTTSAASGLWVVFGRAFAGPPKIITTSTVASTVIIAAPGSTNAGSYFAVSEGASRLFNWIAIGSGRI